MTITLPIPEPGLWPNSRLHPLKRQRLTRAARQRAFFATLAEMGVENLPNRLMAKDRRKFGVKAPLTSESYRKISTLLHPAAPPIFAGYSLAFFFGDRRRRDDDNAVAACKSYRDGIADALRIDDSALPMLTRPFMCQDIAFALRIELYL